MCVRARVCVYEFLWEFEYTANVWVDVDLSLIWILSNGSRHVLALFSSWFLFVYVVRTVQNNCVKGAAHKFRDMVTHRMAYI